MYENAMKPGQVIKNKALACKILMASTSTSTSTSTLNFAAEIFSSLLKFGGRISFSLAV